MTERIFHLGEIVDPATHSRTGTALDVKSSELTTHGVIVGMTGSGKTGLGIVLLEEALRSGLPVIAIDPKGDLADLALTFPQLDAASFAPYVDPAAAQQAGQTDDDFAAAQAELWTTGLADWGLGAGDVRALHDAATTTIYTPGSSIGVPLNIVAGLSPAAGADSETVTDEIEGYTSGLLGLVGIDADPLSSKEHILVANLLANALAGGIALDLPALVAQVAQPPIRKLGVFELDQFFPPAERTKLAMTLNGLLASPSFAAWGKGAPLDIDALLTDQATGRPRAAIISIAHLSDPERQFVVSLVLGKLITWMRRQSGTADLRALVYMDEIAGYCPPTAMPPAKAPMLTLLKQARAFGIGLVLATQNPVDVDYKALSNAGTWMVGRLQTEQDRNRLLDGMSSASGEVDVKAVGDIIAGLAKREFVVRTPGTSAPRVFTTRWAMSYLAGPLTREQVAALTAHASERSAATPTAGPAAVPTQAPVASPDWVSLPANETTSTPESSPADKAEPTPAATATPATNALGDDESPVPPNPAEGILTRWVDPAAPWAPTVGATAGTRYEAAAIARVNLLFDDAKAGLHSSEEYEAVLHPLPIAPDPAAAVSVDYDDRDLQAGAPPGVVYRIPEAPIATKGYWSSLQKNLVNQLVASHTEDLWQHVALKLVSRPGEAQADFTARVVQAAANAADNEAASLRSKYAKKTATAQAQLTAAQDRAQVATDQAKAQKSSAVLSAAGSVLGAFLGGRRNTGSIVRSVGRAASRTAGTGAAGSRVDAATNKVATEEAELAQVEAELTAELAAINDRWTDVAAQITELKVPLKKTNVTVTQIVLGWIPVG